MAWLDGTRENAATGEKKEKFRTREGKKKMNSGVDLALLSSPEGRWSCWIGKDEASIGHQWLPTVLRRQTAEEGAATPEMRGSPRTGDGFRGWGSLLVEKEKATASNNSHQHRAAARSKKNN